MKTFQTLLAALLLAPCACSRSVASPKAQSEAARDSGPQEPQAEAAPKPVAEPEPPPTPEEVAAFHAPVPK